MLEEFNKTFEVEGPFKMIELENAIIRKFGSIQYMFYKQWNETSDYMEETKHPAHYTCGTDFQWEDNNITTDYSNEEKYTTREMALMGLCLDNKNKFKNLVRRVYERNN